MIRHSSNPFLAVLLITACTANVPTAAPDDEHGAGGPLMSVGQSGSLPLSGTCETQLIPPAPPTFLHVDIGTCRITHLGLTQFHSAKEIDFAAGTQRTTEATFTAANGDVLRATGEGTSRMTSPGRIGFTATLVLAGGTGRFANASGEAHVVGEADLASSTAALRIVGGWIQYQAADRRTD
jgi:hypothetical protein